MGHLTSIANHVCEQMEKGNNAEVMKEAFKGMIAHLKMLVDVLNHLMCSQWISNMPDMLDMSGSIY